MRKEITELAVKKLETGERITDSHIKGFIVRCLPSGEISFGYQFTNAAGARKWMGIGLHGNVTVKEARDLAKRYAGQVAAHEDPAAELKTEKARGTNTVDHVLDAYLEIHGPEMRGAHAIKLNLAKHVRPVLGSKIIYDVTRGDVMNLVDNIGKKYPRMAAIVHAYLRAAFNFWMLRDEDFKTPIIRGMVKDKTKICNRVLTPDELRDIWRALETIEHVPACFPAYVKVLFLTACRRCEVAHMHTREIDGSKWTIPATRYKTKADHIVPLIPPIKKLLPKTFGFVFSSDGARLRSTGFGKPKDELDAKIAEIRRREKRPAMPAWTFHDLRRTARTLLAELKVDRDTAERCLGHAIGGIEAHYNHHKYHQEKIEALTKLADHVERMTRSAAARPSPRSRLRVVAG